MALKGVEEIDFHMENIMEEKHIRIIIAAAFLVTSSIAAFILIVSDINWEIAGLIKLCAAIYIGVVITALSFAAIGEFFMNQKGYSYLIRIEQVKNNSQDE